MHTTEGKSHRFYHNSDFSGDVEIEDKSTGHKTTLSFEDLKILVTEYVRQAKISAIENASDDEILGV